jgi:hypothetical protein
MSPQSRRRGAADARSGHLPLDTTRTNPRASTRAYTPPSRPAEGSISRRSCIEGGLQVGYSHHNVWGRLPEARRAHRLKCRRGKPLKRRGYAHNPAAGRQRRRSKNKTASRRCPPRSPSLILITRGYGLRDGKVRPTVIPEADARAEAIRDPAKRSSQTRLYDASGDPLLGPGSALATTRLAGMTVAR